MMEIDVRNERQALLKKVQAADFYALDLQLYLNTHPDCMKGLSLYKNAVKEAKELREKYEEMHGPLTAAKSSDKLPWQWIQNPWTWEKERS